MGKMKAIVGGFGRHNARTIGEAMVAQLKPLEEMLGVKFSYAGGTFSPDEFKVKIRTVLTAETGEAIDPRAEDFKRYAPMYGFTADDLGREFLSNGYRFKIAGFKPSATRYPIVGTRIPDGKRFKFMLSTVRAGLKPAGPAMSGDDRTIKDAGDMSAADRILLARLGVR